MASAPETIESIDALSEALWRDERVFSARERELLAEILEHARKNGGAGTAESEHVSRAVARAVGEVIARRLLGAVGEDIARRVAEHLGSGNGSSAAAASGKNGNEGVARYAGPGPHPGPSAPTLTFARPGPHPSPPAGTDDLVRPGPHPPGTPQRGPGPHPGPNVPSRGPGPHPGPNVPSRRPGPHPKGPGPHPPGPNLGPGPHPRHGKRHKHHAAPGPHPKRTARVEAALVPQNGAPVVVLDEFLAPQELERLSRYVEQREQDFELSEVISPGATAGSVDFEHRRSRVLFDLGEHEAVITGRILSYLPRILPAVGLEPFPISEVEAQITASNDGDYFRPHEDNGGPPLHTRELTFVYFFHREPKEFRGGELRIYNSRETNGENSGPSLARAIVPQQNQMVMFPSHLLHEITPVDCPSRAFLASRFTLNGWFHRPE